MSDGQERIGIKGSIITVCIDTIINTFLHQVFLGLTLSLMKRILPWSTIVRWDIKSNLHATIFRNANFRDYEFFFQKQRIGIIILSLSSKIFLRIFSHLKALIWTTSFFFLSITSDKHPNYSTERSDKDMIPCDK